MPHISRKKLPAKRRQEILNSLVFVLAEIKSKKEMDSFLDALLSETEKLMLAKRLAMFYLLEEGITEENIAQVLNTTQATVSRMRLLYERKKVGYQVGIKKVKKEKLLKELKTLALRFAAYTGRAAGGRKFPRR